MERRRRGWFPLIGLLSITAITAGWWALAFWPIDGGPPEWLARTRAVCFGIYDDGLPDLGGWIGLVGQPLGLLIVLFAGWGRPLVAQLRWLAARPVGRLALIAWVLAIGAGSAAVAARVQGAPGPGEPFDLYATTSPEAGARRLDRDAPPLSLVDQHGAPVSLDRFLGRPVLLTFAFAHCETACPLLVRDVLEAQAAIRETAPDPAAVPVVLVVTLDPWRDTPARLPAIAAGWGFGEDAYMLGGTETEVTAVLDAWGVRGERDIRTGDITHAPVIYVIDRTGRIAYAASGGPVTLARLVQGL